MPRFAPPEIESVPEVEWTQFYSDMGDMNAHPWKRGQHVALIGKTGCGKTTLANALLPLRYYTVVIATKPRSESLSRFAKDNKYIIYPEWPAKADPVQSPKRVLWPRMKTLGDVAWQRYVVGMALNDIYGTGKWCVYADELRYLTETLNLSKAVELFLMQGRELDISFIGGMQRPKFVPLSVYSMSSHLFFWQEKDINNLERISAINSVDSHFIANVVTQLREHEFLYIHSPTGFMCRSTAPDPGK